jgi:hypothetical protein
MNEQTHSHVSPKWVFTTQLLAMFPSIFGAEHKWGASLQPLQMLDGIRKNQIAFTVKTNDTPVILREYNTDPDVAFGAGTGNSSRYGERTEIIYSDVEVPYDYHLSFNEGIDVATVNNDFDEAIADRLEANSIALVEDANIRIGAKLNELAGNVVSVGNIDEENVIALFMALRAFKTNSKARGNFSAYVNTAIYAQLLTSKLMTTDKNSLTNIDEGTVGDGRAFGFSIYEVPDEYFVDDDVAFVVPDGVVLPFMGINETRIVVDTNHGGEVLQGYIKGGTFISEANASVISRVTL